MQERNAIISMKGVLKSYGKHEVLMGIDLEIPKGSVFGLVGKNGSGKTTLFKVLLGLSNFDGGSIQINGKPAEEGRRSIRIGFMVGTAFFPYMTAKENLTYFADLHGIKDPKEVDRVLEIVGLKGVKTKVKGFSLGMRQRLGIANAILGNPEIVILDEPTNGLDPKGIMDIRHLIRRLNEEYRMTMIVSSHILSELQNTADIFGLLNNGVVVKTITQDDLKETANIVSLRVPDAEKAKAVLKEAGIEVLETTQQTRSLEEMYFSLIGGENNDD